jgi:hypothetical protein
MNISYFTILACVFGSPVQRSTEDLKLLKRSSTGVHRLPCNSMAGKICPSGFDCVDDNGLPAIAGFCIMYCYEDAGVNCELGYTCRDEDGREAQVGTCQKNYRHDHGKSDRKCLSPIK